MLSKNKKLISLVLSTLVLIAIAGLWYYHWAEASRHQFKVTFLNIGQGDSALIQFNDGEKMLVDCGPNKIVLTRLGQELAFYDRTIDYVLATHPDLDHYGGCADVVKNYHVKHIIINGREKPYDPYWQEWDRVVHSSGAAVTVMQGHQTWTIASSTLEFFSPDDTLGVEAKADDSNNYSIVFKLTAARFHPTLPSAEGRNAATPSFAKEGAGGDLVANTFLFTGDMEFLLEDALLDRYCGATDQHPPARHARQRAGVAGRPRPPQGGNRMPPPSEGGGSLPAGQAGGWSGCPALHVDVLKVGHHGSAGSSGEKFLAAVRPKTAVISVGKNHYGHPTLRAIRHLERAGAEVLRTDQLGDIVIQ